MREKWIDNAKGIAILLVIIGHTSGGLKSIIDFDFVYGIHLVVFFLVSGYTLKKKSITREFVNNKFIRLMFPYFITCFAVLVMDIFNSYILSHDFSIEKVTTIINRDLLRSFFASGSITHFGSIELGTRIGAIWFFPALFFAIILVQLVLLRWNEKKELAGVILAVFAIMGYISARFIWLPFSIQSGMCAAVFIYAGYMIRENRTLQKIRWYHYCLALAVLVVGIQTGYSYMGFVRADCIDLVISVAVGFAGSLIIYGVSVIYKGRLLQYIGERSLIVLCVHLFAMETMGQYFTMIMDGLGIIGNARNWIYMTIHILFAVLVMVIIKVFAHFFANLKKPLNKDNITTDNNRDISIDIAKGIFIILMVIGHFEINYELRTIIFSCHMIAFVFLSGYFYNGTRNIGQTIKRMSKTFLLPYGIVFVGDLLLNINQCNLQYVMNKAIQYAMGISFSKISFAWSPSVGPVYFILLLFVVRIIYLLIERYITKETSRWIVVTGISLAGVFLGKTGYWLPWSFDVACYCLIFYKLGYMFHKKNLLQLIKENHVLYFIMSTIWAYMIYIGGMEIAVRRYGKYGLTIIGAVMGVLLVIKLADYIARKLPLLSRLLQKTGQATIIVLIIHTLLRGIIEKNMAIAINSTSFLFLLVSTILQILLAIVINEILGLAKQMHARRCQAQ